MHSLLAGVPNCLVLENRSAQLKVLVTRSRQNPFASRPVLAWLLSCTLSATGPPLGHSIAAVGAL